MMNYFSRGLAFHNQTAKINTMDANKIIDEMGGTGAVARDCKITAGAVSQWRENGIPKPWLKYFSLKRPDLFPEEKLKEAA